MLTTLFSLPPTVFLKDLQIESHLLTLVLASALTQVPCPVCGLPSSRIHSRYRRRLADLPCQGRAVRLQLQVRRFFCDAPACSRKTFAEQFTDLAPRYARRTSRQAEHLRTIASALGGRAGMRLVKRLSMPTSRFTLVRLLRQTSTPPRSTPRILGVDDLIG